MKANAKKTTDFPSRTATLAAETDGTSGSEQAEVVLEKRPRSKLPSILKGSAALSYADISFFFIIVFFLAMMFRIGVHLHVPGQTRLDNPTLPFQIMVSLSLIGSLYAITRLGHAPPHQHVRAMAMFSDHGECIWMIQVRPGSIAASALMHAICNATLFLCQVL